MPGFELEFYKGLFESLDNNSVLMRVDEDGSYRPIWCSREYAQMMEGTAEECIRYEGKEIAGAVHDDDKDEVAYLFKNHVTKDGTNSLTIRKHTLKNNDIWVNIHYAFVEDKGTQYAYCTYTDVTELIQSQEQTMAMYRELNKELDALSSQSLAALRSNLTKGVVEEVHGTDLYDVDQPGAPIEDLMTVRLANMPVASDRETYMKVFDLEKLQQKYYLGEGPSSLVFFSRRQSGRQCFIKYSAAMRKDPMTGDVIVLSVETEYNSQKVAEVLNEKVLARQYDMVCYIVDENYGVSIGDAANIEKGSIFPKERDGIYMDYLKEQVIPVVAGSDEDREAIFKELSLSTIADKLSEDESYSVDVPCEIDGEIYHKRFMFYAVDIERHFYILLKSDMTEVLNEQRERERTMTIHNSMLDQFNAMAEESLTVARSNMSTGLLEDVRGTDIYPSDYVGNTVDAYAQSRLDNLLIEGDKEKYVAAFDMEKLLERTEKGLGPASVVCYTRRASGRQCFVRYSGSASRNPVTGVVDAFGIETEYNAEMITRVMNEKILAQQYDMVTYLVGGYYGVTIGDAASIAKGSIFPKKRDGVYVDYINEQVLPVVPGEERQETADALSLKTVAEKLADEDSYSVDVTCLIDGEVYNKRFAFYAVNREEEFYILLKTDVTDLLKEQRERNELLANALGEAEQANAAKTSFLSSMSHEIRTPMNAIIGLNSIALSEPDLPEKTRKQLEKIGGSAKHLLSLINDILDMSRIESGRMTIKHEEFSFREMLAQINTMIGGQCQEKGLIYDCRITGHVDDFYIGDDMKLKQVIINILGNSVKFTPEGGTVTFIVEPISRFEDKATMRFIMKDTGVGMDKKFLPKIFEAFSQEDGSKANKYGSTGLGMAITKNIVEMMNGKIVVESEKGVGSTFTVTVTLKTSDKKAQEHADVRPQDLHVLVIDDDPVACEHAKLVLEEVGIVSDSCFSGTEALEMLRLAHARREAYNLILVDLKMPEQNGIDVTREIRKLYNGESTIIILTAYSWDDIMEDALAAGVDSFMAKPLFASGVVEEFKQAIQRKNISRDEVKKADLTGRHILLAEDMFINAEIMKELLRMKEMEVDHAENGKLVVEMFADSEENYYDAILMDVRMPEMTGLEATEAIRALERPDAKEIPIIAMTANAFDEDVQRSLQVGMNAHLSKPVEPEQLYETLEILIKE